MTDCKKELTPPLTLTFFPSAKMVDSNFIDSLTAETLTIHETVFPFQFRKNNLAFRGHKCPIMFSYRKDLTVHKVPALAITIKTAYGHRLELLPFISMEEFEKLRLATTVEKGVDLTSLQRKNRAAFIKEKFPETVSTFVPRSFKAPHAFSPIPR